MSRIKLNLKKMSIELPSEKLPQDGQKIISKLESSEDTAKLIVLEFSNEIKESYEDGRFENPVEPWVKDMNELYQKVMSTIIT